MTHFTLISQALAISIFVENLFVLPTWHFADVIMWSISPPERSIFCASFLWWAIFPLVSGVFFRKYTQKAAQSYNIFGWCKNTREGTVKGLMEGQQNGIEQMSVVSSRCARCLSQNGRCFSGKRGSERSAVRIQKSKRSTSGMRKS